MNQRVRVLIADDHPVVRYGIASCLRQMDGVDVVGEAADGQEALRKAAELKPDLVLMDLDMPRLSGFAAAETLRKNLPQIKILVLTMHSRAEFVVRIIRMGLSGCVLKQAASEDLLRAVRTVASGQSYFSPELARMALNRFVRGQEVSNELELLTAREREVLVQIAEGLSNKEIASQLGVGVRTIETHRERVMRKLNIRSVAGLTRFALSRGLVALQEDKLRSN